MMIVLGIILFIALYGSLNYYIGLKGWQIFSSFIPFLNMRAYWILFWVVALAYILGRFGSRFLPSFIDNFLTLIGSYWMAALLYFLLFLAFLDFIRLLNVRFKFLHSGIWGSTRLYPVSGLMVFIVVIVLLAYGTYNSHHPSVRHYDITIKKSSPSLNELHIVMASDIHLGNIVKNKSLTKMVDMINNLKPDLILFAGDIIDEDVNPFIKQNMSENFKRLKAKYGSYAVLGNHEYIGGQVEAAADKLNGSGIKVLRDEYVKLEDSFYLVGREDLVKERFVKEKRMKLDDLINGIDTSLPIILLDHQPSTLDEAEKSGVDLQLSGHTHVGQFFPNNLITGRIYEVDWGYLLKENLNVIVTSGYGTWGPPIRIGNHSEIVDIMVHFE